MAYTLTADINKFDPITTRCNGENALVLADCAGLVYESEATIKEIITHHWHFTQFEFFNGVSSQAFIAGNDSMIIVAFGGTERKEVNDIKADASIKLVAAGISKMPGKVHAGFKLALDEVWGTRALDMSPCIKRFQNNQQSVWFCGHSLGAALATLAAAEFVIQEGGVINGVYSIGQPRVGNAEFAGNFDKALGERCFRIVNNNDVVPQLPVWGPVLNYTHVGNLVYIDSRGVINDSVTMFKRIEDFFRVVADDLGNVGLDNVKDHYAAGYIQLLAKNRVVTTK